MNILLVICSYAVINGNPIPIRDIPAEPAYETSDSYLLEYPMSLEDDQVATPMHGPILLEADETAATPIKITMRDRFLATLETMKHKLKGVAVSAKGKAKTAGKRLRLGCAIVKPVTGVLVDIALAFAAMRR